MGALTKHKRPLNQQLHFENATNKSSYDIVIGLYVDPIWLLAIF
jgi:hypothetical protein